MDARTALADAFARITTWMRANEAAVLADNLAPGANEQELDEVEGELGFRLHPELRALWSVHDGQLEEMNGFVECYDLVSARHAMQDRETPDISLESMREYPKCVPDSGMSEAELASDRWLLLASRDSDGLAVENGSGRVFAMQHDDVPSLRLVAPSVVAWLERYAARVAADDFEVEEGFGDGYLSERDRAAEAREAAALAHETRERARHATMSAAEIVREAIAARNEDLARDAIGRAREEALDALFAKGSPEFVASTLRPLLRELTLPPARWRVIADGGARLGNNAVRDLALAKSRG